jgi:DNA invertase Pin-like site-specific DNA recombinase
MSSEQATQGFIVASLSTSGALGQSFKTMVLVSIRLLHTHPQEINDLTLKKLDTKTLTNKHRLFYASLMTTQRLGYGRVSTQDQNLEAQADALKTAGANKLFIEKITGTKASRPELDKLREQMRAGDTLVITRLDRLGRSAKDLLEISADLETKGVALEVLEQNINTTTPEGKLFFTLIAAFAEFEHSMMVARTKDGLAAARARGRVGGRKPKLSDAQKAQVKKHYDAKELTIREIAALFNITPPTVYRALEVA